MIVSLERDTMQGSKPTEPVLFEFWSHFLEWLWEHTEKFPKNARFTITHRVENLSLEIMEDIVRAMYSAKVEKLLILKQMNCKLEILRVILRLTHHRQYLAHNSFEYAMQQLLEAGKMIGGWIQQQSSLL